MQKGRKFSALVDYFRTIATEHIAIRHSNEEKHFFRLELDEVITGLPESACYPLLVMEGYSFTLTDQKSDNISKKRSSGFLLASHVSDRDDYEKIHQTWDDLEEIGDDILARIRADKQLPDNPVRSFDISSVEARLISSELGNLYGIRYTFDIDSFFPEAVDTDKWISS
jgi:hypothetical protein